MRKMAFFFLFFIFFAVPLHGQNPYVNFERELELTGPQRVRIEAIRNRYAPEWQNLNQESMRKRLEIRYLNKDRMINMGRINRLQGEIRGLEMARNNLYNQYRWEVARDLNERQRRQYEGFVDWERRKMPLTPSRPPLPVGPSRSPQSPHHPGPWDYAR